jgi:hypothetical protein
MKLLRLTLRDLFWLVLVGGLGCAWWVERQKARQAFPLVDMPPPHIVIQEEDESRFRLNR